MIIGNTNLNNVNKVAIVYKKQTVNIYLTIARIHVGYRLTKPIYKIFFGQRVLATIDHTDGVSFL
jgi:hypothetical protein